MRVYYWLLLLTGLLGALPGCRRSARMPAAETDQLARLLLPPVLQQLLAPTRPPAADVATLQAHRAQWAGDSLGCLLVHHRLAHDFTLLGRADSILWHLRQAWRVAGPAQCRQQPGEVATLGCALGKQYYKQAVYDSASACLQRGIAVFHAAGFDSIHRQPATTPELKLPSGIAWGGGLTLAGTTAHLGLARRHLGDLAGAVRCYDRATVLYQQLQLPKGSLWMQCLTGEAYAEQHDYPRARAAYDQALRAARYNLAQKPTPDPSALLGVVLDYYEPLLLAEPHPPAYATQLAREMVVDLRRYAPVTPGIDTILLTQGLVQLNLVPVEVALRNGQPPPVAGLAAAERWLLSVSAASYVRKEVQATQAVAWGLRAWQQHATNPAAARHLLAQATALLGSGPPAAWQARRRQQVAGYCLAMHEPAYALRLLRPLVPLYQRPLSPLPLSQVTELLTQAYAGVGRYDSAYQCARRTQALTDSLRAGRQFAALAATEARYRTREQAGQIQLLTERDQQQTTRVRLVVMGAALLAGLLLAMGLSWRATRRLNYQLTAQAGQLQAQAQRLGEQARQLGELDAAKNQFFANVSHELRTPLTLVLGPLQQSLLPQPAAARRELLATSLRHAQRLRGLIDRILDLTKLEAGKLPVHLRPASLSALLSEQIAQFTPLAVAGGLLLHRPPDVPATLTLLLDIDKVSQILTNLLANAVQHTPPGGQVLLTFAQPGPSQYALTVQDTGPGIAEIEQERLFERFYQSPQRQARGGTGLGLALSRELAQLLGGQLTLSSKPGQGAAFTFTFPAERLPAVEVAASSPALPPAAPVPAEVPILPKLVARARLLLVEDHAELRAYMGSLLAPHYEVLEAEDGRQALAVLANEVVDLVASDAMMPRISGLELLQTLKADPARKGIPFLMVTARADEAHRLAALTVGVDDYLTKPFEATELLARVRALLANQQVRQHYATLAHDEEAADPADPLPPVLGGDAPALAASNELASWQTQVAGYLADPAFGPDELAAQLLLSRRTLYRRLGELAGLTPAAWLRELRLAHARRLLEAGSFSSVTVVAEASGFANVKYFSTVYAERFGRRPGDYDN